jgi:hypothetical protein
MRAGYSKSWQGDKIFKVTNQLQLSETHCKPFLFFNALVRRRTTPALVILSEDLNKRIQFLGHRFHFIDSACM